MLADIISTVQEAIPKEPLGSSKVGSQILQWDIASLAMVAIRHSRRNCNLHAIQFKETRSIELTKWRAVDVFYFL